MSIKLTAGRLLSFVIVAALVVTGCQDTPRDVDQNVVLNQAFEHILYLPLYVAKDAGYFANEGLSVSIETGGGDAQAFTALTSGTADFAQGDPAFVAIAEQEGWEGRVVALAVSRVAMWGVTSDSTIPEFNSPQGFKGLTVATLPEPNTAYVVQKRLLQEAGLISDPRTAILQVPFGTEISTLRNNRADIAMTVEPNASRFVKGDGRIVFSYPEAFGPLAFTGVMTSLNTVEDRPQMVQSLVNAYADALTLIHTSTDSASAIAKKRFSNIEPEVVELAVERLVSSESFPKTPVVDTAAWNSLVDIRVQVGDLSDEPPVNLIDNSFVSHAMSATK